MLSYWRAVNGPGPAILGHIRPQGRENSMSDDEVPGDDEWLRTVANSLLQRLPSDRDRALRVIGHLCELVQSRNSGSKTPRPRLTLIEGGAS
jgi:hypothetical protein